MPKNDHPPHLVLGGKGPYDPDRRRCCRRCGDSVAKQNAATPEWLWPVVAGISAAPQSLANVAREVGVVPQSVYLHLSDETQLVGAVIERRFGELSREPEAAESGISDPV